MNRNWGAGSGGEKEEDCYVLTTISTGILFPLVSPQKEISMQRRGSEGCRELEGVAVHYSFMIIIMVRLLYTYIAPF